MLTILGCLNTQKMEKQYMKFVLLQLTLQVNTPRNYLFRQRKQKSEAEHNSELYLILVDTGSGDAAVLGTHQFKADDGNEVTFRVTRGDYSQLMKLLVENISKAKVNLCDTTIHVCHVYFLTLFLDVLKLMHIF